MIEIGIFTTGCSDMPFKTSANGIRVPDATLEEINESAQRVTNGQIRQAVLADRLGYDYFWMSEHHFCLEGSELSPNPLQSLTAIAALTKRIRLGTAANILTWHHPLRLAEQIALLDTISGGRVEAGFGRGYQPRETETWGATYGSSHADQERNRQFFDEAFELVKTAWTEKAFDFHGDFFNVPPKYLKFGHPVTAEYFASNDTGYELTDIMSHEDGSAPTISATGFDEDAYLRKLCSLPRPVQKPYPPMWQLMVSPRSVENAAKQGLNGYFNLVQPEMLKQQIDEYMRLCEKAGWPDMLDRGEFKPGWDAEKHRGLVTGRWLHCTEGGVGNAEKFREGIRRVWNWYDPYGFGVLVNGDQSIPTKPEDLEEKGLSLVGGKDQIIEGIMNIKNEVYPDSDFYFNCQFEGSGLTTEENEEQIQFFAEEIAPVLRQECGGGVERPESDVQLVPDAALALS
ncbi:MAG: LLM class flavin-dependent oxidoreductase [Solirubrobacteraceae bacterium]